MNYNAVVCVVKTKDNHCGTYYSELNCNMDVIHELYDDTSEIYFEYDNRGRLVHELGIVPYDSDMNHEIWYEYDENDHLIYKCWDDEYEEWRTYNNGRLISTKSKYKDDDIGDVVIYFSNVNGYMMVDDNLNITVREYNVNGRMTRYKFNNFEEFYKYNESGEKIYYKRVYKDGKVIEREYE